MKAKPTLGDAVPTTNSFQAGDRVVVRCPMPLPAEKCSEIVQNLHRMAGVDLRILFVPVLHMQICLRGPHRYDELAGPNCKEAGLIDTPRQVEVGILQVDIQPDDVVEVKLKPTDQKQAYLIRDMLKHWVGDANEILFLPWLG